MADPSLVDIYLKNGMYPTNLNNLASQSHVFRDAVLASIGMSSDQSTQLQTLVTKIASTQTIDLPEDVTMCELAATIAWIKEEEHIFKEVLLRVPPNRVTSYLHSLYTNFSTPQGRLSANELKGLVTRNYKETLARWEAVKANYTI
jgi:hypothetical protein